jgi:hypothetical protein
MQDQGLLEQCFPKSIGKDDARVAGATNVYDISTWEPKRRVRPGDVLYSEDL